MSPYKIMVGSPFLLIVSLLIASGDIPLSDLDTRIRDLKTSLDFDYSISESSQVIETLEMLGDLLVIKDKRNRDSGYLSRIEAIDIFQRALKLTNNSLSATQFRLHLKLGEIYRDNGQYDMALSIYKDAEIFATVDVENSLLLYCIGLLKGTFGFYQESINIFNDALSLAPNAVQIYLPLVENLRYAGDFSVDNCLKLKVDIERKIRNSDFIEYRIHGEEEIIFEIPLRTQLQLGDIYWALYLIHDILEEPIQAFEYLSMAKEKLALEEYSQNAVASQSSSIMQAFKDEFFPDPEYHIGSISTLPVFIVGMPRSGASVLEAILAAHPRIYGLGDASVYSDLYPVARNNLLDAWSQNANLVEIRTRVDKETKSILETMLSVMKNDTSVPEQKKSTVKYIVDKPLSTFRTLGMLSYLFPKALVININRDPMDNILSCYTNNIADNETATWANNIDNIVHEHIQYLQIIDHYRKSLPNGLVDVSYEELVTNPKRALEPVLERLGLAWHPSMLQFHKSPRNVPLRARSQLSKGLSDESIGRWLRYSYQLLPSILYLKKVLPIARDKGYVAFSESMNWDIDEDFEYPKISPIIDERDLSVGEDSESSRARTDQGDGSSQEKAKKSEKTKKNIDKGVADAFGGEESSSNLNNKKGKKHKRSSAIEKSNGKSKGSSKLSVALIVPVTSKGISEDSDINELPLFHYLVPSLSKTMTNESKWTKLTVYLGYDEDDPIYDNQKNLRLVKKKIKSKVKNLSIKLIKLKNIEHKIAHIWNALISNAYDDKNDYFCILSDDAVILTKNWLISLVNTLKKNTILPNFGTVAFYEEHKFLTPGTFPTFPSIHRTHLEIFGKDFTIHPSFMNTYSDPYIADIYSIFNSALIAEGAKIRNTIGGEEKPRYTISIPIYQNYVELVISGRKKIASWIRKHHPKIKGDWQKKGIEYGPEGLHYKDFCLDVNTVGCKHVATDKNDRTEL